MADSPQAWYAQLPPVCRLYGTACVLTTVAWQLGIINPMLLIIHWPAIIYKFQVWRLATNFILIGKFSMSFLMRLLMLVQYGVPLERVAYAGRTADFVYALLFGAACLLGLSAVPALELMVLSSPLIFFFVYVWSRSFPTSSVSIWGLFTVKAFYLPWAFLLMGVLMGGSPVNDLIGIVVGHLYYFFAVLHPRAGGRDYLRTPAWVHALVAASGLRGVQLDPAHTRPAAPRTFGGAGRRLGTQ